MALIKREELLEIAEQQGHVTADDILSADIIDAAPVVHGRWICDNSDSLYKYHCSVCKKERHSRFDRYCSNCGCKMKENK